MKVPINKNYILLYLYTINYKKLKVKHKTIAFTKIVDSYKLVDINLLQIIIHRC